MSSYLTIRLNKSVILCSSRNSRIYEYCELPNEAWGNYIPIKKVDLANAIENAEADLKNTYLLIDKYEKLLGIQSLSFEEANSTIDSIFELKDDIETIKRNLIELKFIENIFEEQRYLYDNEEDGSVPAMLEWMKG